MTELNFITVGDKNFFIFICYSAKLLKKIYPSSKFFVYNWGFTINQITILKSYQNVILIDWTARLKESLGLKKVRVKKNLYGSIENSRLFESFFIQKPYCLLDCAKRIKENLIYLDADAFLINPIDELFDYDIDIGVTIRINKRIKQIWEKTGIFSYINAGVIFFLTSSDKIFIFLREWINNINFNGVMWLEQTALNHLIADFDSNFYGNYYNRIQLKFGNKNIKIIGLPCEYYNHYEFESGFNPKKTKILHFRLSKFTVKKKMIETINKIVILSPLFSKIFNLIPIMLRDYFKPFLNINIIVNLLNNPFQLKNICKLMIEPINHYRKFKEIIS